MPGRAFRAVRRGCAAAALFGVVLSSRDAAAQTGTCVGRVTTTGGEPVPSALVRVTAEGDTASRWTRSGDDGRYQVTIPSAARVVLSVERIGYHGYRTTLSTPHSGALTANVALALAPNQLAPLEVRAAPVRVQTIAGGHGGSGDVARATLLQWQPATPGSLADAALLAHGVVPLGETASGVPAVSIAGQDAGQNRVTVDGAGFGGAALPAEAVKSVGVVVSTYDVARGQFLGGQIAATTIGGTDDRGGVLNVRTRAQPLSVGGRGGMAGPDGVLAQVSGAYGGPLRRGKLFGFGAFQWARQDWLSPTLDGADADALRRRGVDADSVRRLGEVLAGLGVRGRTGTVTPSSRQGSAIARLDFNASEAHRLGLRLDGRWSSLPAPASPLSWRTQAGERSSRDGGVLLSLSSRLGGATNELRAYGAAGAWQADPGGEGPGGRVLVASEGFGPASLEFGGGGEVRATGRRSLLELNDALRLELAGGAQRLQAGFTLSQERSDDRDASGTAGLFTFQTLDDLAAGHPATYTRTLGIRRSDAAARYAAVYAGHTVQLTQGLGFLYGLRLEHLSYPDPRAFTPDAAALLGGRAARIPSRLSLSQRAGFSYDVPTSRPGYSHVTLRGGAGRFVGRVPLGSLAAAAGENGSGGGELVCLGAAAPAPVWSDAAVPPTACGGAAGKPALRDVSLFAPGFAAPSVWRGSLAGTWSPVSRFVASVSLLASRGAGNALAHDRSLAPGGYFTLPAEGRVVFAPAEGLDAASGMAPPTTTHGSGGLGTVREITSGGRAGTVQLTAGAFYVTRRTHIVSVWYTHTRSWDEASPLQAPGGPAPLAGSDGRAVLRGPADFERSHAVQIGYLGSIRKLAQIGVHARFTSGMPYTPRVAGDVNGDGQANDAAFVFAPGDGTGVPAQMAQLLESAPDGARSCLRRQMERVAGRNTCRGPWTAQVDAQASFGGRDIYRPHRLNFTATATNLAGLADWAVNGSHGLRGWGRTPVPDATLLYVRGFDPARRAFAYEVNPSFGRPLGRRGAWHSPFALTLQLRFTVGSDPAEQWLLESQRDYHRFARPPASIRTELAERARNLPGRVLLAADSLGLALSPAQAEPLRLLADSLQMVLPAMLDSLAAVASLGDTATRPAAPARVAMRRMTGVIQELLDDVAEQVRAVLTEEQWERLPATWREPAVSHPLVPMKPMIIGPEDVG